MYPIGKTPPLWTMNLHPVIKDENADGSLPIEGTMHQCVDHKLNERSIRNLQLALRIELFFDLHVAQVTGKECHDGLILMQ